MCKQKLPPLQQKSVIVAIKTLQRSDSIRTRCPKFSARVLRGKRTFWWFICQNTRRKIKMWGIIFTTGTKDETDPFTSATTNCQFRLSLSCQACLCKLVNAAHVTSYAAAPHQENGYPSFPANSFYVGLRWTRDQPRNCMKKLEPLNGGGGDKVASCISGSSSFDTKNDSCLSLLIKAIGQVLHNATPPPPPHTCRL